MTDNALKPVPRWVITTNLSLLILFPIAWFAPLAHAGLLPFFKLNELTVISGIISLWKTDMILSVLVIMLAVLAPIAKVMALAAMHLGRLGPGQLPLLDVLSKLAMADVFLIAVYIVVAKGVGVGRIETGWGLYLFTLCVTLSMVTTYITKRALYTPVDLKVAR